MPHAAGPCYVRQPSREGPPVRVLPHASGLGRSLPSLPWPFVSHLAFCCRLGSPTQRAAEAGGCRASPPLAEEVRRARSLRGGLDVLLHQPATRPREMRHGVASCPVCNLAPGSNTAVGRRRIPLRQKLRPLHERAPVSALASSLIGASQLRSTWKRKR